MLTKQVIEPTLSMARKILAADQLKLLILARNSSCLASHNHKNQNGSEAPNPVWTRLSFTRRLSQSAIYQAPPAQPKCKKEVHYDELKNILDSEKVRFIDVREPKELEQTGKIHPAAINIPLTKLKEVLKSTERFIQEYGTIIPQKQEDIIFYGYADIKSVAALEIAHKMGYKKARHYPGGWLEWSQKMQATN